MAFRSRRPRPSDELQQELISTLGWHDAMALIRREARALGVDPESGAAIRHAYAAHQAERPTTNPSEQEHLL